MESLSNSVRSWFSNLGVAIVGIFLGWIPFLGAIVLLFWNEIRSVKTERALAEGAAEVISIPVDSNNPRNNGRLVHLQGVVSTSETLRDPIFGVSAQVLRLRRVVEMYQWREREERQQTAKSASSRHSKVTYHYDQVWSTSLIDSTRFHNPAGHENPIFMPFPGAEWSALKFQMAAFRLEPALSDQLKHFEPLAIPTGEPAPEVGRAGFRALTYSFYQGGHPNSPGIGDVRVAFEAVKPTEVSVIAGQEGNTLTAFQTRTGGKLALLQPGKLSPTAMFRDAHFWNWLIMWACRTGGYFLMILAVRMVLRPLNLVARIIPSSLGALASASNFLGFIFATGLTMTVTSLTWVAYRPRIGLPLLAGGLLLGLLVIWITGRRGETELA